MTHLPWEMFRCLGQWERPRSIVWRKDKSHQLLFTTQGCMKPRHCRLRGILKVLTLLLLQINYSVYIIYEHLTKQHSRYDSAQ